MEVRYTCFCCTVELLWDTYLLYVFIFDVVPIPDTGNQQPLTTHGLHIWPFLLRYSRTGPVNKLESRLLDYYCFDNGQNTTEFGHGLSAAVARSWSGSYYPLWCGCSAVDPDPQGAICLAGPGCVLRSTRCRASWARNLRSLTVFRYPERGSENKELDFLFLYL
jgi:hypothetical protein